MRGRDRTPTEDTNRTLTKDTNRTLTHCDAMWGSEVRAGSSESIMLVK